MKKAVTLLTVSLILAIPVHLFSQSANSSPVRTSAEHMPEYPGGRDSLIKEISSRIVYPQVCLDSNIEGKVYLRFVVKEDGAITDIMAANGPHTALKGAAMEAAKGIGKFTPATESGQPVSVYYSVPVTFKIRYPEPTPVIKEPILTQSPPEFPGGGATLLRWIQSNTKYPLEEIGKGIQGKVNVQFTITEDGSIENAKVIDTLGPAFDKEALRVIAALPAFKPALQNGKPAKTIYTLAVPFKEKEKGAKPDFVEAQFPGGAEAANRWFHNWLTQNNFWHQAGAGSVVFSCTISAEGHVKNVLLVPSADRRFDEQIQHAAVRLPDYIPATLNGNPVESTLDIRFTIY